MVDAGTGDGRYSLHVARTRADTLESFADEVTIHFPWGPLLRGALAEDESVFAAICRLPRQGGALTVLVSLTARDGRAPLTNVDVARVSHACRRRGFSLVLRRDIARTDVDHAHSSWGSDLASEGLDRVYCCAWCAAARQPSLR